MEEKNPIQVADRIFSVLEALSDKGPMSLGNLSTDLCLNKSTVHRILNSLICMNYVKQDENTGKYSLTFKVCDIANRLLTKIDIVNIARPFLKRLVEQIGETVHLVQIDGIKAVYIDKVESYSNSVRMVSMVGKSVPLYCSAVGKSLLAEMDDMKIKEIWEESEIKALTPHTIVDFDRFSEEIRVIRERGYALDNEENEEGVRCIAVCLKDYKGLPKYAFSISAPISRMDDERLKTLSPYVLDTQQKLLNEWKY